MDCNCGQHDNDDVIWWPSHRQSFYSDVSHRRNQQQLMSLERDDDGDGCVAEDSVDL
jgi:hypothetical protein